MPEIEIFMSESSDLAHLRSDLLAQAHAWQATYCLLADTDHTFPVDALLRLLSHQVMVVGLNYLRRGIEMTPTAVKTGPEGPGLIWSTKARAAETPLEEVDHIGLGFCLIHMGVVTKLREKARADGADEIRPLFDFRYTDDFRRISEDTFFMQKLRAAGIPIHVDHVLSRECSHIAERELVFGD